MKSLIESLRRGILTQNPTFILVLGMCPTIAVTTSVVNGIGMGLSATVVLIFSNLFISILRNFIPSKVRIAGYIVVIASFVTIIQMLLQAYVPTLYNSLGIFIPLIVVNCIILARAEAYASKNSPFLSALDGLGMGLGFTCSLTLISAIREILGSGSILGWHFASSGIGVFVMAPGGFLVLGSLLALFNYISQKRSADSK
ncbi:MAG: electron transport complex subunit E [Bacillota bacterium]|nr:electron transport complex subunit E [Bacillota bacterium]